MDYVKQYRHICLDSPLVLRDGERLIGVHIIQGGSGAYGRFLFTTEGPVVQVIGHHVLIKDCILEGM